MKVKLTSKEAGQTLVWVAIAMVVLLAFVGLAIEGGNAWGLRRQMQNAADAGALAGAYEICFGTLDPVTMALNYAETNGATRALSSATRSGGRVDVTAVTVVQTVFVRLVGINTINVPAHAAAACGEANRPCMLWPIGYPMDDFHPTHCGETFILWGSDNDETYQEQCSGECNCDVDGDGVPEYPLDGRTWIDFSRINLGGVSDPCEGGGCGADEIKSRVVGYELPHGDPCLSSIEIPSCTVGAAGLSGEVAAAWNIAAEMETKIVHIPLYDPAESVGGAAPCELDEPTGCGANEPYKIEDVGCVRIVASTYLYEKDNPSKKCGSGLDKVIVVEVACGAECASECSGTSGEPCEVGDVCAVSLIE